MVTTGAATGASTFARERAMNSVTDMTTSALARPATTCRRNGVDGRGAGDESIRAGVMRAAAAAPIGVGPRGDGRAGDATRWSMPAGSGRRRVGRLPRPRHARGPGRPCRAAGRAVGVLAERHAVSVEGSAGG